MKIVDLRAHMVLDSRGNPTVAATAQTRRGCFAAQVPSGASTGAHEAAELRDGGRAFHGFGVAKAVENVNRPIRSLARSRVWRSQKDFDAALAALDGTVNKKRLGANAVLAASLAVARAFAAENGQPLYAYLSSLSGARKCRLPVPFANVINGGKHAGNALAFQEYLLVPVRFSSFAAATQAVVEVYHALKENLAKQYGPLATNVGDEGGFAPALSDVEEPLRLLADAVDDSGYRKRIALALDCAATSFYKNGEYTVGVHRFSRHRLLDYYEHLIRSYPLVSVEDPLFEDDFAGFAEFTQRFGRRVQVVADDLTVTNPLRVRRAVATRAASALLLKVNQIGSLTEALEAAAVARTAKWSVMVSHRSGETTDAFIADLAVGLGCGQIKLGAPARGERTAKYNRLLEIEPELGRNARYGFLK